MCGHTPQLAVVRPLWMSGFSSLGLPRIADIHIYTHNPFWTPVSLTFLSPALTSPTSSRPLVLAQVKECYTFLVHSIARSLVPPLK